MANRREATRTPNVAVLAAARELADGPFRLAIRDAATRAVESGAIVDSVGKPVHPAVVAAAISDHIGAALTPVTRDFVTEAQDATPKGRIATRGLIAHLAGLSRQGLEKRLAVFAPARGAD